MNHALDLIDGTRQTARLDHSSSVSLRSVGISPEQSTKRFDGDVLVQTRDGKEVVLKHGLVEDGASITSLGELVIFEASCERGDFSRRKQAVEEDLFEDRELWCTRGTVVSVESSELACTSRTSRSKDCACDCCGEGL